MLFHAGHRQRAALLGAGLADAAERARAEEHCRTCASCAAVRDDAAAVEAALLSDPLREEPLPIPLAALQARIVQAASAAEATPRGIAWWPPLAAAAAIALAVVVAWPRAPRPVAPTPPSPPVQSATPTSDAFLRRMEAQLAREHAAHYLSDAQDVLVAVSEAPQRCRRGEGHVDVEAEAQRSRQLLARRTLLVESDHGEVASARAVLLDVDDALREVAQLPACARALDVERLHRRLRERRLLLKIDLVTRELVG